MSCLYNVSGFCSLVVFSDKNGDFFHQECQGTLLEFCSKYERKVQGAYKPSRKHLKSSCLRKRGLSLDQVRKEAMRLNLWYYECMYCGKYHLTSHPMQKGESIC